MGDEEITLYSDDKGIKVTNTRLVNGTTTYSVSNIASLRKQVKYHPGCLLGCAIVTIALGPFLYGIAALFGGSDMIGGLFSMLFGLAIMLWIGYSAKKNKTFAIFLIIGNTNVLFTESKQESYIDGIMEAINKAIAKRT